MRILTNRLIIYAEFKVVGGSQIEINRFFQNLPQQHLI